MRDDGARLRRDFVGRNANAHAIRLRVLGLMWKWSLGPSVRGPFDLHKHFLKHVEGDNKTTCSITFLLRNGADLQCLIRQRLGRQLSSHTMAAILFIGSSLPVNTKYIASFGSIS